LIEEDYRLPLVKMSDANRAKLKATLKACEVMK
jgi:dihydrodipicolinate synthase/N-acetylneuraminate lyase